MFRYDFNCWRINPMPKKTRHFIIDHWPRNLVKKGEGQGMVYEKKYTLTWSIFKMWTDQNIQQVFAQILFISRLTVGCWDICWQSLLQWCLCINLKFLLACCPMVVRARHLGTCWAELHCLPLQPHLLELCIPSPCLNDRDPIFKTPVMNCDHII
jgi:hypothetical protein